MNTRTNQQLTVELTQLQTLIDESDEERGYCLIDFEVSDYFAYEVYQRNRNEVMQFLLIYADIIIQKGDYYDAELTQKISKWIDCFDLVTRCKDILLASESTMIVDCLKLATNTIERKSNVYKLAYLITFLAKDRFSPYWIEMERLDYEDNYDAYLTQKKGRLLEWRSLL